MRLSSGRRPPVLSPIIWEASWKQPINGAQGNKTMGKVSMKNYHTKKGSDALRCEMVLTSPKNVFCCLMKRLNVEKPSQRTISLHLQQSQGVIWLAEAHGINLHVHREDDCREGSDGTQDRAIPVGLLSTEEEMCAGILCCHPGPSQSFQIPLEIRPGCEPFSRSLLLPAYPWLQLHTWAALRSLRLGASFRHSPSNNPKLRVPAVFHHYNPELPPLVTGSPHYLCIQIRSDQ